MSEDTKDPLEAAIEAARTRHPTRKRLKAVDTPAGIIVLGVPSVQRYEAYLALGMSEENAEKAVARKTILLACAVEPSPEELARIVNDPEGFPALPSFAPLTIAIQQLTGAIKEDAAKK